MIEKWALANSWIYSYKLFRLLHPSKQTVLLERMLYTYTSKWKCLLCLRSSSTGFAKHIMLLYTGYSCQVTLQDDPKKTSTIILKKEDKLPAYHTMGGYFQIYVEMALIFVPWSCQNRMYLMHTNLKNVCQCKTSFSRRWRQRHAFTNKTLGSELNRRALN